ncbi:unnamed protein product, partial [Polarella glacialis]
MEAAAEVHAEGQGAAAMSESLPDNGRTIKTTFIESGPEASTQRSLSMTEPMTTTISALSVRTDWSSESEASPRKTAATADGAGESGAFQAPAPAAEQTTTSLQSGRTRTLMTTISPRFPLGAPVRYGVHSIQNRRSEMEDAHRAVLGVESSSPSSVEAALGNLSYFAVFDG